MSDNKKLLDAIWENPDRVFGCQIKGGDKRKNSVGTKGKISIKRTKGGVGISVYSNHGTGEGGKYRGIWEYLGEKVFNTSKEQARTEAAKAYGITLEYSEEEKKQIRLTDLAFHIVGSLKEALRLNPDGATAAYLKKRGLDIKDFGELTEESLKRAKEFLSNQGKIANDADLQALGLTVENARKGYNLVIPNYQNGVIKGFILRILREPNEGENKYLATTGAPRGYCSALKIGEPAYIVEGEIDAITLMQSGFDNVIALGGASYTERIAKLLDYADIKDITLIPDNDIKNGVKDRSKIEKFLKDVSTIRVGGESVINNLYISELSDTKDVNNFIQKHSKEMLCEDIRMNTVESWRWQFERLVEAAQERKANNPTHRIESWFQSEFDKIYTGCPNPYEREKIKNHINDDKVKQQIAEYGITPNALTNVEDNLRNKEYINRLNLLRTQFDNAMNQGANPAVIAEIAKELSEVQATNTRDEWDKQIYRPFKEILTAIANRPDTLKTKWELGNIGKNDQFFKYGSIEYWPSDIAVYCAPTSHGKTMFLMQSALDMVRAKPDLTFLYISCEEDQEQLTERALNVYLDIPTTESGKDENGKYCFKSQTRKKAIAATIKGANIPYEYNGIHDESEHFNELKKLILQGIEQYENDIQPRLIFLHTDDSAESIAANVMHYVEKLRNEGKIIGGVFVDYMQLLNSETKHFNRTDELKDVCKSLKRIAVNLTIPLILAAQLNRESIKDGIDKVTVANLGESADIERIAHDLYFIWQVDKTKRDMYFSKNGKEEKWIGNGDRSNKIFSKNPKDDVIYGADGRNTRELKNGYMYVEQLKARDGKSGGWALYPFDGERGTIESIDKEAMKK